jgi:RNA recognition motif-containing protein
MNIYIGNLVYEMTEDELKTTFEEFGQVDTVKIITDKFTGRSKGFGFIEMSNDDEAKAAIEALNDKDFQGRSLKVSEARPKPDSSSYRN